MQVVSKRLRARAKWLLQGSAFVSFLAAWLLIRSDLSRSPSSQDLSSLWSAEGNNSDGAITSHVLSLQPSLELFKSDRIEVTVRTRQLRFSGDELKLWDTERVPGASPPLRVPASRRSQKSREVTWSVREISRLNRAPQSQRESVSIIRQRELSKDLTGRSGGMASVYVELEDGLNNFEVIYQSSRGETKKLKVRVRYRKGA